MRAMREQLKYFQRTFAWISRFWMCPSYVCRARQRAWRLLPTRSGFHWFPGLPVSVVGITVVKVVPCSLRSGSPLLPSPSEASDKDAELLDEVWRSLSSLLSLSLPVCLLSLCVCLSLCLPFSLPLSRSLSLSLAHSFSCALNISTIKLICFWHPAEAASELSLSHLIAEAATEEEVTLLTETVSELPLSRLITEEASKEDAPLSTEAVSELPPARVFAEEATGEDAPLLNDSVSELPLSLSIQTKQPKKMLHSCLSSLFLA